MVAAVVAGVSAAHVDPAQQLEVGEDVSVSETDAPAATSDERPERAARARRVPHHRAYPPARPTGPTDPTPDVWPKGRVQSEKGCLGHGETGMAAADVASESGTPWWMDRIREWQGRGFVTDALEKELREDPTRASDRLLRQERLIESGEELRGRVEELPASWQEERHELLELLRRPEKVPDVETRLRRLDRQRRPWGPVGRKSRHAWSVAGERDRLYSILQRFDRMVGSDLLDLADLVDLLPEPENAERIEDGLTVIEQRRRERLELLDNIGEMLENEGFDTSALSEGDVEDRFRRAAHLQSWERVFRQLQATIGGHIRRHDPALAESLEIERRRLIANEPDVEHERFREQVERHERDLSVRLVRLQQRLDGWRMQGYRFPGPALLGPEDLLTWELRSSELARDVGRHEHAWSRLERLRDHWPTEIEEVDRLRGDLTATDVLQQLAQDLQDTLLKYEQNALERIRIWQQHGLPVMRWLRLVRTSPRIAAEHLEQEEEQMQLAVDLVDRLEALDTSLEPDGDTAEWIDAVRAAPTNIAELDRVSRWLARKERRTQRLRAELEEEWEELGGPDGWPEGRSVEALTLSQLERIVVAASSGRQITLEWLAELGISDDEEEGAVPEHLIEMVTQARGEIASWAADGWETQGVEQALVEDPDDLIRQLPDIRSIMGQHEGLRRRLRALAWERDPDLAEEVAAQLRRPDRLADLVKRVPHLANRLARGVVVDAGYVFPEWWPGSTDGAGEDGDRPFPQADDDDGPLRPRPSQDDEEDDTPLPQSGDAGISPPLPAIMFSGMPDGEGSEVHDAILPPPPTPPSRVADLAGLATVTPPVVPASLEPPAPASKATRLADSGPAEPAELLEPLRIEQAEPPPPEEGDEVLFVQVAPPTPAADPLEITALHSSEEAAEPLSDWLHETDIGPDEWMDMEDSAPGRVPSLGVEVSAVRGMGDEPRAPGDIPHPTCAEIPDEADFMEDIEPVPWIAVSGVLLGLAMKLGLAGPARGWEEVFRPEPSSEVIDQLRRGLAGEVGRQPRDVRVDRLLRLTLRALPGAASSGGARARRLPMLKELHAVAEALDDWTRERLLHRDHDATGGLLERSLRLGLVLSDIPGPGAAIPLEPDDADLPAADQVGDLAEAVSALLAAAKPRLAGAAVRELASDEIVPELRTAVPGRA